MSPKEDLSNWLTIDQAAARLGVSRRTVERRLKSWDTRKRSRPDGPAEVVISPASFDQAAPEIQYSATVSAKPAKVPANVAKVAESVGELTESGADQSMMVGAIAEAVSALLERILPTIPAPAPPDPLFVDLHRASQITGLSVQCLRRLVEAKKFGHMIDGHHKDGIYKITKVRRADLENFDPSEEAPRGKRK